MMSLTLVNRIKRFLLLGLIPCFFFGCITKNEKPFIKVNEISVSLNLDADFTETQVLSWPLKYIEKDTMPGISLERAYYEILAHKPKGEKVVVALIDMPLHKDHELIKDHLWTNTDEVANNQIDDDKNGFVDDIHGWNFLGNSKGENYLFTNYAYTSIIPPILRTVFL